MDHEQRVVVTLSNDRPFAEVEKDLAAAGLAIDQALAEIGVVTGTCKASRAKLRAVRGVSDVSDEQGISMGPPGSRTTW